ncbi:unnamed protein product [Meloidogyne enterolobii]|uniref:Uncharacterized protein n=1 Tax=Meloidogyne enterolobii TaxID=390850 RepID=A0ACB0YE44_MELEN
MKLGRILIILLVNAIFWSLINSVKNNKNQNELARVGETSKDNDGAESSVNPQIRMLKPKPKITKNGTTNGEKDEKRLNINKYMRIYYQNNKEKKLESVRKYYQKNKEKKREYNQKYRENNREMMRESGRKYREINKEKKREKERKYRENNREKIREFDRKYRENNRERRREAVRKYREKRKNKKENLKYPQVLGNVHYENNGEGGTSNPQNDDVRNKGKMPIVYEERIRSEERSSSNQEDEETEAYVNEQNKQVVEEPNKIPKNCMNQINLNEYPFDLNEKPEDNHEYGC